MPRDNSGVVIGERGALVTDSGINGAMAKQIQERVRQLTDKPLNYVGHPLLQNFHRLNVLSTYETLIKEREASEVITHTG